MSILDNAKQHFKQILDSEGLQCIEVPEWSQHNQPAKIYFKPLSHLSIKTYSQWVALGSQQTVEAFVDMLILRCLDEQSQPIFKNVHKTEMLREISPIVVCDVIAKMSQSEVKTTEQVMLDAKND